jgi:hypothetical protein
VTATLSGFATPLLSGGACAIAAVGIVRQAAASNQNVTPMTRTATPVLIAFSLEVRASIPIAAATAR